MTDYSVRTYTADEIPADIIDELDLNTNNIEYCTVFDSLEDFAIYEVEDGQYSTLELNHDYHGAQRKALTNIGLDYESVGIIEIDKPAENSYNLLHGQTKNFGDITQGR